MSADAATAADAGAWFQRWLEALAACIKRRCRGSMRHLGAHKVSLLASQLQNRYKLHAEGAA